MCSRRNSKSDAGDGQRAMRDLVNAGLMPGDAGGPAGISCMYSMPTGKPRSIRQVPCARTRRFISKPLWPQPGNIVDTSLQGESSLLME